MKLNCSKLIIPDTRIPFVKIGNDYYDMQICIKKNLQKFSPSTTEFYKKIQFSRDYSMHHVHNSNTELFP